MKIKSKIVDDFINALRDFQQESQNPETTAKMVKEIQTLDVNLVTNSLKGSHIDYIIMLRKLSQFMEQNKQTNNISSLKTT